VGWKRWLAAGTLLAAGAVLIPALPASAGSVTITVYSGQHPQTTAALVNAFEKQTGISVSVRNDDEDVLANQIVAEGGRSPADVLFTENSPALEYLQTKGLLAKLPAATLARVPSRFNSPQRRWVGVSARVSVLVYNTQLLSANQLPTSVMDLARPQWRGKLALAPGETDFQPVVTSVAHRYGQSAALQWLDGVKANAASHLYPDNETVTSMVNAGQVALGVINQYYWYRLAAQEGAGATHSAIAFFAPKDPGYVLDVSGAAVLSSSHQAAAAQRFVSFLTTAVAQGIIAHSDSFEYPIGSGVTTAQPEAAFSSLQPNSITLAQLGTGALAVKLLQEAQLL
jgi:iron(III) transport system substrate-binding protein